MSIPDVEKRALIESMVRSGLTLTERSVPENRGYSEQMRSMHQTQRALVSRFSISIPVQNEISKASNSLVCERAVADGYDWCALVDRLPSRIKAKTSDWHPEFDYAELVKPLAVVGGYMYVMTFSPERGSASNEYGLMRISKDADQLIWYRHMGSGFGLGHCEELRGLENWKPDGSYRQCWRRQILLRGEKEGLYSISGYPSVQYESVR
jgi:hypothetical protein